MESGIDNLFRFFAFLLEIGNNMYTRKTFASHKGIKRGKGGEMIRSKLFLILTLHRSGSSATAGVLYHLGVHMGQHLLKENEWNPKGHFENEEFVAVNDRILHTIGGSWKKPPSPELIKQLKIPRRQVKTFLLQHAKPAWGIKDPRMLLTFDLWKGPMERVADITYIIVHRPIKESIASLVRRNDMTELEAQQILLPYLGNKQRIREQLVEEGADIIDVHFSDLLQHPDELVAAVNQRLGRAPKKRLDDVRLFLDHSLKHF